MKYLILCTFFTCALALLKHNKEHARVVVALRGTACENADQIAAQHGYRNLGEHESLSGYHIFEELPNRKRDSHPPIEHHPDITWYSEQKKHKLDKRKLENESKKETAIFEEPKDPQYPMQWHLKPNAKKPTDAHLNVLEAWRQGVYGDGVLVSVVDDGVQYTHPDLMENFDQRTSYDWNDQDDDVTPHPRLDDHGTPSAGLCCGARNGAPQNVGDSSFCGVGVAYMARVAGLRLIATDTEDWQEAHINWGSQYVDVYSNSWGPTDDGNRLEGPGPLAAAAVERAIASGRNGKGAIYVFAGGNGRTRGDNCNYDGWANWRYTVTIAAVTHTGKQAWYSEDCSCLIASVPSSGDGLSVTTTDLLGSEGMSSQDCTATFSGTSAAAPMAAGVVALMLDANPALGWRDVQGVIIESVTEIDPTDHDWQTNKAGHKVSHHYGFGLLDAGRAVYAAKHWVPWSDAVGLASGELKVDEKIAPSDIVSRSWHVTKEMFANIDDLIVEHVEVNMTVTTDFRGSLAFNLTSPSGTVSRLQEHHHDRHADIDNWRYQSIMNWGESPLGEWKLTIDNNPGSDKTAHWFTWHVLIHTHSKSSGGLPEEFTHYQGYDPMNQ